MPRRRACTAILRMWCAMPKTRSTASAPTAHGVTAVSATRRFKSSSQGHENQPTETGDGLPETAGPQHEEHQRAEAQADEGGKRGPPVLGGTRDERDRRDAQDHRGHEPVALADEIALLLLEGTNL